MPGTDFAARRFEVRSDVPDTRDELYECSAETPPPSISYEDFKRFAGPVQDQGVEPSCTGMALAGVANYMMRRHWDPEAEPVSPRMMYEMARRHDHLSDDEEGSNPRGAIKGWHKHGVCSESLWPYTACTKHGRLTFDRVVDASRRLMASYVKVQGDDLEAMRWGIAEYGVLYAASRLHEGWREPDADHVIVRNPADPQLGGHAFVMVGYDERGFWIQNSWAEDWGIQGCALLTYEDWLENRLDVWATVVDVETLERGRRLAEGVASDDSKVALFQEMWPHVVVVDDEDGKLARHGSFGAAPEDLVALVEHFEDVSRQWETPRLAIVVGAGITGLSAAVREAATLRADLLAREIYPVFVLWRSDWLTSLVEMLERVEAEGQVGELSHAEWFERAVSDSLAKDAWAELELRAHHAVSTEDGAARLLVDHVLDAFARNPFEIHLVAHGIGDALLSEMAHRIGLGSSATVDSCTLWAPATTTQQFGATYGALLESGALPHIGVFALDDDHELADCVGPYEHSILYLASRALGATIEDEAILGMQRVLDGDPGLRKLRKDGRLDVVIAPTSDDARALRRSEATTHGGFITDPATITTTIARVEGGGGAIGEEIESRDPLVRARAVRRAQRRRSSRAALLAEIEECGDCRRLRAQASVG